MHLILNLISCFGPAVLEYVQRLGGQIIYKVELRLFIFEYHNIIIFLSERQHYAHTFHPLGIFRYHDAFVTNLTSGKQLFATLKKNCVLLCPIHVVTFTLISNLATDYIQKRRGEPGLFSFE